MRVSFADFTLDRQTRQLFRGTAPAHLEPKAFELLDLLLTRRPAAVSKSQIQDHLWPDTFVSEGSITGLVAQIREVLGDQRTQARFVRTVHGFGYAFSAEATESSGTTDRARHRLVWEHRVMLLAAGENVLGRAEDATLRIDAPGVSRHHARIVVQGGRVRLEDLGSKNGTYLGQRRLEAPAELTDGDAFRLGSQVLVFRRSPVEGSTATEPEG